jgi:hypothetical protein
MFRNNNIIFNKIHNKIMTYINVFGPAVLNGILGDIDSAQIVIVQSHNMLSNIVLLQYLFHPK